MTNEEGESGRTGSSFLNAPVEWVEPVSAWLQTDPRLAAIADVQSADVSCFQTKITPHAIWDPTGRGLPTSFPARAIRRSSMELHIANGYLDGHRWIVSSDKKYFTSDEAETDGTPNLLTDLDTKVRAADSSFGLAHADRVIDIAGAELAVSAEPSNWGSFLVRALPKIAAAAHAQSLVLSYMEHPNQRALAELLGVQRQWMVAQSPRVRYRLTDCVFRSNNCAELWVSKELRDVHREAAERAVALMGSTKISPRIYLSRLGSIGRRGKRSLTNEVELARVLADRGFEIISPEDRSPIEVIAAIAQAQTVVTAGGAGMFNTVFAGTDTFVLNLESEPTWLYGHTNVLQSVLEDRWALFYGNPVNFTDPAAHRAWSVDVPALCHELDQLLE